MVKKTPVKKKAEKHINQRQFGFEGNSPAIHNAQFNAHNSPPLIHRAKFTTHTPQHNTLHTIHHA
jgi:hypothetical protein